MHRSRVRPVRTRAHLAVAQIAVFVAGGVLGPVAHLAWHRPGHSHGPDGQTIAFDVEAHGRAVHRHATPPAHDHHAVPDRPEPVRHEHEAHSHPPDHEARARPSGAESLDSTHGHGSLAHFALALLSAAPPLALPTPEPAGVVPRAAHPRAAALFHASFPLSRPPPEAALS